MTEDALVARLRAAGCVFAEDEAGVLRSAASRTASQGASATASHGTSGTETGTVGEAELERLVRRRIAGDPLEVVVGYAEFAGLRIPVTSGVFVPRARTQLVSRIATELAPPSSIVLDLCCGSGAIAAAIAHSRPDLTVWAADIDPVATSLAAQTLAPYGARAVVSDMDAALPRELRRNVAVLASCPPYVPSAQVYLMPTDARDHEPLATLDGGSTGAVMQARVFAAALRLLGPDGTCIVETSEHVSEATLAAATAAGFTARLETDDSIGAVVVVAHR